MSSHTEFRRARLAEELPLLVALAAVAVVATYINLHKSIWLDETFTLSRTDTSLTETLYLARHRSLKPPLYFVLVYYWRKISPSIEFTRLLSTVSILLAVYVLHRLSGLLKIGTDWLSLAVLAALTPHLLWAAAEARPYALAVLCLAATVYFFTRLWVTGTEHPGRATIGFVLSAYGALLTFYYTGFILAALFLAGLLTRRDLRRLVWSGIALAVLMLPWMSNIWEAVLMQAGSPMADVELPAPDEGPIAGGAGLLLWMARSVGRIIFRATPFFSRPGVEAAFWFLLGAILLTRLLTGRPRWSRNDSVFALFTAIGFLALTALRLKNVTTVDERHWIIAVPGLLIVPSLLRSEILPAGWGRAGGYALLAVFGLSMVSFARNERGPRDWRTPAVMIMQEETAGEPIVCFNAPTQSFLYYYRGVNPVLRMPRELNYADQTYGVALTDLDRRRLLSHLALSAQGSFWLVEREWPGSGPRVLEHHMRQSISVIEEKDFHQSRVYHLRLAAPIPRP